MVARITTLLMIVLGCVVGAATSEAQSSAGTATPPVKSEAEFKAAGHRPVTGSQLRRRLVGNTSYIIFLGRLPKSAAGGINFVVYYPSDKERIALRPDGIRSSTLWWIDGDQICGEEKQTMPGGAANRCYVVYDTPSLSYMCRQPEGECLLGSRLVPGNPENL